jgi:hypothetical protein
MRAPSDIQRQRVAENPVSDSSRAWNKDSTAVRFHPVSANSKLAPIKKVPYNHPRFRFRPVPQRPYASATYASIEATCSDDCPFKKDDQGKVGGCFIEAEHFTRKLMARLDGGARERSAIDVMREEAALIDASFAHGMPQDGARGGRDLRIHVGGDVPNEQGARLLAGAAARWLARGGGRPWTYTHTWRRIPAEAFWPISVLASVERPDQVRAARARGYVPAIVVDRFPNGKKPFEVAGTTFIPCPAETVGRTCVECRLCLTGDLFERKAGIAFQVHGADAVAAKSALVQIGRGRSAA